ncbi:MAG TPA: BrnT family toxin, partial [Spirochaetes bacterium]|nr:BrnT family toxin [Spirochaetota bacterium]
MGFEWDSEKNKQNFQKHGILFEEAREIFRGPVLKAVDDRID